MWQTQRKSWISSKRFLLMFRSEFGSVCHMRDSFPHRMVNYWRRIIFIPLSLHFPFSFWRKINILRENEKNWSQIPLLALMGQDRKIGEDIKKEWKDQSGEVQKDSEMREGDQRKKTFFHYDDEDYYYYSRWYLLLLLFHKKDSSHFLPFPCFMLAVQLERYLYILSFSSSHHPLIWGSWILFFILDT